MFAKLKNEIVEGEKWKGKLGRGIKKRALEERYALSVCSLEERRGEKKAIGK